MKIKRLIWILLVIFAIITGPVWLIYFIFTGNCGLWDYVIKYALNNFE